MNFVTMVTPYLANGQVDYDAAERYVHWYASKGLNGIFAICQSSEIFYLSLEERVTLNRRVYQAVQRLKKEKGCDITVVSSGHVSYDLNEQARELCSVYDSGTDALILITNRLDPYNEGDETFIRNAEALIARLPREARLGLYECPHPYNRQVTPRILDWCLQTGRFDYMKDTCCNLDTLRARCAQVKDTSFKLLNANTQTLLASYRYGAKGFCGIMANLHPALYVRLGEIWDKEPQQAELLQAFLCSIGNSDGYPLSAKYNLCLEGIETASLARPLPGQQITPYQKHCVEQMKLLCDHVEKYGL